MRPGSGCLTAGMSAAPPDDAWLDAELRRLLSFGRRVAHPLGGAAWLDEDGVPDLDRPVHTWITSRTVHVFGLGAMLGVEGSTEIAAAAQQTGRGVVELLRERRVLTEEQIRRVLDPVALTSPHRRAPSRKRA